MFGDKLFRGSVIDGHCCHSDVQIRVSSDVLPSLTKYSSSSLAVLHKSTDLCDRLMSWRVPQKEHERISETGVFLSMDRISGTLCLLHYVTEISHLYSLRDFWRHFGFCTAAAHSDCCFFAPRTNIPTFILTYITLTTHMYVSSHYSNCRSMVIKAIIQISTKWTLYSGINCVHWTEHNMAALEQL